MDAIRPRTACKGHSRLLLLTDKDVGGGRRLSSLGSPFEAAPPQNCPSRKIASRVRSGPLLRLVLRQFVFLRRLAPFQVLPSVHISFILRSSRNALKFPYGSDSVTLWPFCIFTSEVGHSITYITTILRSHLSSHRSSNQ